MHNVLRCLQIDGSVEMLPAGFHSRVVLVSGPGGSKEVIKVISKNSLDHQAAAQQLADDIKEYARVLQQMGIPVPHHRLQLLGNGALWDVVIRSPFCGYDIAKSLRSGSEKHCLDLIDLVLGVLERLFQHPLESGGLELEAGIDPKPDNFSLDGDKKIWYVDTVPPRYRRDGEPLVEFPPPRTKTAFSLVYHRHYTVGGILEVLLTQFGRLRPDLYLSMRQRLRAFIESFGAPKLCSSFADIFANQFVEMNAGQRLAAVENLRRDDMYAMRGTAIQLVYEGGDRYGQREIDLVFRLSHFFDDVPPVENIERVKTLLTTMIGHKSTDRFFPTS